MSHDMFYVRWSHTRLTGDSE